MPRPKRPTGLRNDRRHSAVVSFARRLRRHRVAAGLTQEALAHRAGMSTKFVSQVENARVNPSHEAVARIVEEGLRLSLAAFFAENEETIRDDLRQLAELFGGQPGTIRRRALRVLRAVCDE